MHTIRLRGPWSVEPVARFVRRADGAYERSNAGLPSVAKVTMPADWSDQLGADFFGSVRYRRTFQKPTGLDSGERVFLFVEGPRSWGRVTLSRRRLGDVVAGATLRVDITDQLEEHNTIEIDVDHPALNDMRSTVGDPSKLPPGGLVGEVRLEIEE